MTAAPLAFVTIVDDKCCWYKSRVGPAQAALSAPVEASFCQYVIDADGQVVLDDVRIDPRTRDNPATGRRDSGAWAGFPVRAPGGEVLGSFCVADTAARRWSDTDKQVLETLARAASGEIALRAALADAEELAGRTAEPVTVAARASRRRAEFARTLQQSLLPPELPDVPGLDIGAAYVPASTGEEVVGDFYDVFEGVSGSWCVAIGDVCGKGPEAASITGLARWTPAGGGATHDQPPEGPRRAALGPCCHQRPGDNRHITVALATIRRRLGRATVTLSAAGHPLPLLRRADGTVFEAARSWKRPRLVRSPRPVRGQVRARRWRHAGLHHRRRPRGPPLLAGTHPGPGGVRRRGPQRVVAAGAASARELAVAVMDAVEAFRDGPPVDDTAAVVIHVTS